MVHNAFHLLEAIIPPNLILCLLLPFLTTVNCPLLHVLRISQIHTRSLSSLYLFSAQPPCAAVASCTPSCFKSCLRNPALCSLLSHSVFIPYCVPTSCGTAALYSQHSTQYGSNNICGQKEGRKKILVELNSLF